MEGGGGKTCFLGGRTDVRRTFIHMTLSLDRIFNTALSGKIDLVLPSCEEPFHQSTHGNTCITVIVMFRGIYFPPWQVLGPGDTVQDERAGLDLSGSVQAMHLQLLEVQQRHWAAAPLPALRARKATSVTSVLFHLFESKSYRYCQHTSALIL
jgi:hypothetical protein